MALLFACGEKQTPGETGVEEIRFSTADDVRIASTLYRPLNSQPPGIVLLHSLGGGREQWAPFARAAQRAGIMCLAIDMRGHGDTARKGDRRISYKAFEHDDWLGVLDDIEAALAELVEQGASPDDLAVGGSSIGANLALAYAARDAGIQAAVLVSPGFDYHGVKAEEAMADIGKCPVLLITSESDTYSASTCGALKKMAEGYSELREYGGGAHGTDIFVTSATAMAEAVDWLGVIIGPKQ